MVDEASGKCDRIDQETSDNEEARDEQGLADHPRRIVLNRTINRQSGKERADNSGEIYEVGNRARHRHNRQHQ